MKPSIIEATDRFVQITFDENPNIKNFGDFKNSLLSTFESARGKNAKGQFDEETIIHFFESDEAKSRIKDNVSKAEFERLYGDGNLVQRVPISSKKLVVVSTPKLKVHSHTRAGRQIKTYNRGFTKWSPAEAKFLQIRRARKLTPSQVIREYNQHFKENPRSPSSIKTKLYRS